jgi:hypothetical protein
MVKSVSRFILIAAALFSIGAMAAGQRNNAVIEGSKAASMDACVAPTSVMRRKHFKFIEHQRHITVHEGIRDTKYSLAGCIDCHVAKDSNGHYIPVNGVNPENGKQQFCAACHEYTGTELACFSCHATVPTKAGK